MLEFIENGKITLIASTTENPYFYIYPALISRCTVFEFKALKVDDIIQGLKRGVADYIAGMTDDYCLSTFNKIYVPKFVIY